MDTAHLCRRYRGLLALVLLLPGVGLADAAIGHHGASASAHVNIRVVVAPVVRVLENTHPTQLREGDRPGEAAQRIVFQTNVRAGACVALRAGTDGLPHWAVRSVGGDPVSIEPQGDGYRLCSRGPGVHTWRLEHRFDPAAAGPWPLRTELTLL